MATAKRKAAAAKKPAKRKPPAPPDKSQLATLAMTGKVDQIFALTNTESSSDDALAYKWLQVAADFGHDDGPSFEDVVELTSLRHDDDRITQGMMQFEIAAAYLSGGEGLPRDHARAKQRLTTARECGFPNTKHCQQLLKATRKTAAKDAVALLNKFFP